MGEGVNIGVTEEFVPVSVFPELPEAPCWPVPPVYPIDGDNLVISPAVSAIRQRAAKTTPETVPGFLNRG